MRHGLAENQFETVFSRALSATGEKQALSVTQQLLKTEGALPSKMLVSPFQRTQETADIVHKALGLTEAYKNEELLVHFADHRLLADFLMASQYDNLIVISHMPIVAELCQYMVAGCDIYGFQTAQMVRIEFDDNQTAKISDIYLPKT